MKKIMLMLLALVVLVPNLYAIDFMPYTDTEYKKKPSDAPIETFFGNEKPTKDYKVIGEITGTIKNAKDVRVALQREARNAGGDAVIEIQTQSNSNIQNDNKKHGLLRGSLISAFGTNIQSWTSINAKVIVYTGSESKQ